MSNKSMELLEEMRQDMKQEFYEEQEEERKLRVDEDFAIEVLLNQSDQMTVAIEALEKMLVSINSYGWEFSINRVLDEVRENI